MTGKNIFPKGAIIGGLEINTNNISEDRQLIVPDYDVDLGNIPAEDIVFDVSNMGGDITGSDVQSVMDGVKNFIDVNKSKVIGNFTAAEDISAGNVVSLKDNEVYKGISLNVNETDTQLESDNYGFPESSTKTNILKIDETRKLIVYDEDDTAKRIFACVVDNDGTTITKGTTSQFSTLSISSNSMSMSQAHLLTPNTFVVFFSINQDNVYAVFGSIVGNTVSFEPNEVIVAVTGRYHIDTNYTVQNNQDPSKIVLMTSDQATTKFRFYSLTVDAIAKTITVEHDAMGTESGRYVGEAISFNGDNYFFTMNGGYLVVNRALDNTLTVSSKTTFNGAVSTNRAFRVSAFSDTKAVVVFSSSIWIVTFSSNNVSGVSSNYTFVDDGSIYAERQAVCAEGDSGNTSFVVFWWVSGITARVSRFNVNLDTSVVDTNYSIISSYNSSTTIPTQAFCDKETKAIYLTYNNFNVSTNLITQTTEEAEIVGVADEDAFTGINCQTLLAGVSPHFSGLTPNERYYAQSDGSVTTTLGKNLIGIAKSATEMTLFVDKSHVDLFEHTDNGSIHYLMLDEDAMESNSNIASATQQSIKAYVDNNQPRTSEKYIAGEDIGLGSAVSISGDGKVYNGLILLSDKNSTAVYSDVDDFDLTLGLEIKAMSRTTTDFVEIFVEDTENETVTGLVTTSIVSSGGYSIGNQDSSSAVIYYVDGGYLAARRYTLSGTTITEHSAQVSSISASEVYLAEIITSGIDCIAYNDGTSDKIIIANSSDDSGSWVTSTLVEFYTDLISNTGLSGPPIQISGRYTESYFGRSYYIALTDGSNVIIFGVDITPVKIIETAYGPQSTGSNDSSIDLIMSIREYPNLFGGAPQEARLLELYYTDNTQLHYVIIENTSSYTFTTPGSLEYNNDNASVDGKITDISLILSNYNSNIIARHFVLTQNDNYELTWFDSDSDFIIVENDEFTKIKQAKTSGSYYYINANNTNLYVYPLKPITYLNDTFIGVSNQSTQEGNECEIVFNGIVSGIALNPGNKYYASENGILTTDITDHYIGYTVQSDQLLVDKSIGAESSSVVYSASNITFDDSSLSPDVSGSNVQVFVDNLGTNVLDIQGKVNETRSGIREAYKLIGLEKDALPTVSFDDGTLTVTISGDHNVWLRGTKQAKTTDTIAISNTDDVHFVYYDEDFNLTTSTTPWDLTSQAPVTAVVWSTVAAAGKLLEERHTTAFDGYLHSYNHNTFGSRFESGFTIADYTLDTDTVAGVTYSISQGAFWDEDIYNSLAALTDGGPYSVFWRTGASGAWTWSDIETLPFLNNGTNIEYNEFTGATWQRTPLTSNGVFTNYYVIASNISNTSPYIIIPSQSTYLNIEGARAEILADLDLGSFSGLFVEVIPLYKITFERLNANSVTTFKASIHEVEDIIGTKIKQDNTTNVVHNATTGKQGGTTDEYYHLTESQFNDFIGSTEVASISGDLQTQITTISGDLVQLEIDVVNLDNDLQSQIVDISGDVASIELDIDSLQTDVADISGNVAVNASDISDLEIDATSLYVSVNDISGWALEESDLEHIESDISSLETHVEAISGNIVYPAGTQTEIQYRLDSDTFGAVAGSSWDSATLVLPITRIGSDPDPLSSATLKVGGDVQTSGALYLLGAAGSATISATGGTTYFDAYDWGALAFQSMQLRGSDIQMRAGASATLGLSVLSDGDVVVGGTDPDSASSAVLRVGGDVLAAGLHLVPGLAWTIRSSAADNGWLSVCYGNGLFVAVSYTGSGNRVMTSPDGITWTIRSSAADNDWLSVCYGNGLFVAVALTGSGNRVMTSPDGITWTIRSSAADNGWFSVCYGNGLFVAVAHTGSGNRVMTSGFPRDPIFGLGLEA